MTASAAVLEAPPADRLVRVEAWFRRPTLAAAALVLPGLVLDVTPLGAAGRAAAATVNWLVWLTFLAEAIACLAVAPRRWEWLRRNPGAAAVVLLTPPVLPVSFQAARLLRLARLARVVRAARLVVLARAARRVFSLEGLGYAAVVTIATAIGAGTTFAAVEPRLSPLQGIWLAVSAMTTGGYVDLQPATAAGKALGLVVILVGIGFESMVIGAVAQQFVEAGARAEVEEVEEEVEQALDGSHALLQQELRAMASRLLELEQVVHQVAKTANEGRGTT